MNAPVMGPCRGVVRGGMVVLTSGVGQFPEESEVLVVPLGSPPGSSPAVLAAVDAAPHLTREDVEELEQVIAMGRRPLQPFDPFGDIAP